MNESACIACCLICTLAERMKDCNNCPFKAGLAVKAAQVEQAQQAKENTEFIQEQQLNHFTNVNLAIMQY